jgi:hypothetical protein
MTWRAIVDVATGGIALAVVWLIRQVFELDRRVDELETRLKRRRSG